MVLGYFFFFERLFCSLQNKGSFRPRRVTAPSKTLELAGF